MKPKRSLSLLVALGLLATPRPVVAGDGGAVAAALIGGFVGGMVAGHQIAHAQLSGYGYGYGYVPGLPIVPVYPVAPLYPVSPFYPGYSGAWTAPVAHNVFVPERGVATYDSQGNRILYTEEGHVETLHFHSNAPGLIYLPPPSPGYIIPNNLVRPYPTHYHNAHRHAPPPHRHFQLPSNKGGYKR